MALQTKRLISPEEYLAIERSAQYKSEYLHGEMFAMAGASREHNLIVTNSVAELRQQPWELSRLPWSAQVDNPLLQPIFWSFSLKPCWKFSLFILGFFPYLPVTA